MSWPPSKSSFPGCSRRRPPDDSPHPRVGKAYDRMQGELQGRGKELGREAPGFDPIAAHADLATRVASGDITRDVALELIQHRQAGAPAADPGADPPAARAAGSGIRSGHRLGEGAGPRPARQRSAVRPEDAVAHSGHRGYPAVPTAEPVEAGHPQRVPAAAGWRILLRHRRVRRTTARVRPVAHRSRRR